MEIKIHVPDDLLRIGELIRTQNNCCTDQPFFAVEKMVRRFAPDGQGDGYEWVNTESGDYETATPAKARRLDTLAKNYRDTSPWEKFHYEDDWEFVTGCFTAAGCQEHIERNGHNLGKTRIYAYGSFRNPEFQAVRNFLMNLPPPKPQHPASEGDAEV